MCVRTYANTDIRKYMSRLIFVVSVVRPQALFRLLQYCWPDCSCLRLTENRMCYAKSARVDGRNEVTIKRILAEEGQEAHHGYP